MPLSIAGKTAIVTGAADGIGLAVARLFVDRGARVMFADSDEERLADVIGHEASGDGPVRMFAGDLTTKLCTTNLISATVDAFDRIDILVNASQQVVPCDPLDPEATLQEAMLKHNLMLPLRLAQLVARRMIRQRGAEAAADEPAGAIVNVSSTAARYAHPSLLAYAVSCAALEQATRGLAAALAPHRIRVNAVACGSVMTGPVHAMFRESPEWRDAVEAHTPLGRVAGPEEVAETVQYLASEASGFVTGQVVAVDGGRGLLDPAGVPAP